ncbi:hypothetical protein HD553DRAFT_342626 [Filobasidium floriforme]|uniref:uncharacterized protein n=1 Tax=Filobasidium floriforme TaxID=5210 RepID=UPI001E8D3B5E|nr:uncharacterized protein HD553DRAFT_342626 [Filobasidium floriforme]KAH8084227.1 hypothetical protein HD553DRAFT_342626 [Filobasidium floriforme]
MPGSDTSGEATPYVNSLASAATIAAPDLGGNSFINSSHFTHALSADELLESTMATGDDPGNSFGDSSGEGDSSSPASDQTVRPSATNRLKTYCIDLYDQIILEGFKKDLQESKVPDHTNFDNSCFPDATEDENWASTQESSKPLDSLDSADEEDFIKPERPSTYISSHFKMLLNHWNNNCSRLTVWMNVGFMMRDFRGDIREMITGVGPFEDDIWLLQTPMVSADQLETALEDAWQALNIAQPGLQHLTTQAKLDEIKLEVFGADG